MTKKDETKKDGTTQTPEGEAPSGRESPASPASPSGHNSSGEGTASPRPPTEDPSPPETFPREVVDELRQEAAESRTRAKRADELESRLLDLTIREAASGILEDPSDAWRDREVHDFLDEDGLPSEEKVRAIAEELARERPHLAKRQRPSGDVGQGPRPEPADAVSGFARALQEAAG